MKTKGYKLCRFQQARGPVRVGILKASSVLDLSALGVESLTSLLEGKGIVARLKKLCRLKPPCVSLRKVRFLTPVEGQVVWAAGVTYFRSKTARMEESDISASAYDLVYDAKRPELFMKSLSENVVHPGDPVGIRKDARWNVPEPELSLVMNSKGDIVGYTVGNDMSSRDIEGENLLYLPQAKLYHRACTVGPCIVVGPSEKEVRSWTIRLQIRRKGREVFGGSTKVNQIKRSFKELAGYLYRSQKFPNGAVLLTGTGIVPSNEFTLRAGDWVKIAISGIGTLENPVVRV